MTRHHSTAEERAEWIRKAREELPPGATAWTVLRHVSASGMTRAIDVYALTCDGGTVRKSWLSYWASAILRWPFDDRREAVKVSGAGMDMGFHLVYALSSALYPDGFDCIGEGCPSNDHSNGMPRVSWTDWTKGVDRPHHRDGGYALRQAWM